MNEISTKALKSLLYDGKKINIIDIRNNNEYILNKIPTAKNIPKLVLENEPTKYLVRNEKYYIYCQSGTSSKSLVTKLISLGYDAVNITGGFNNYLLTK